MASRVLRRSDEAMEEKLPTGPVSALGLVEVSLQPAVLRTLEPFNVTLETSDAVDLVVASIESECPSLLLIDTELMGCPADLCCFARGLRPDVIVLAIAYSWSEREEALRECADGLLHKPPRQAEWQATFRRFEIPERKEPAVLAACAA